MTTLAPSPEASPTTDYPAHALLLRDTIPTSYAHRQFIAFNINSRSGQLDVVGRGGGLQSFIVSKGQKFTADQMTFQVLEIVANLNPEWRTGRSTGPIVILPIT